MTTIKWFNILYIQYGKKEKENYDCLYSIIVIKRLISYNRPRLGVKSWCSIKYFNIYVLIFVKKLKINEKTRIIT